MIGGFKNPILAGGTAAPSMNVDFVASTQSTQIGATISFTNLSDPTPLFNFWDFGDGDFSTASNPDKVYQDNGTYSVTLNACNSVSGGIETKTGYIFIEGLPIIVVRNTTTNIFVSNDGINFQTISFSQASSASIGDIQYLPSQDMFLAIDLGVGTYYQTSVDGGQTWTRRTQPGSGTRGARGGMIYDNKVYFNRAGGTIIESSDGINWTTYTRNGTANAYGISSDGTTYITCTDGTTTQRLQISTNLTSWTNTLNSGTNTSVEWIEDFGLFIVYNATSGSFYTSPTGTSWTTRTVPSKGTSNNRYPKGAYSPKLGIHVMPNSDNAIRWSDDGITYTLGTLPGGYTGRPHSVIWVDKLDKFFAYGNTSANAASNIVLVSTDGKVWTQETANVSIDAVQCAVKQ